ncbi:MAG: flagellar filament capping protein FliD [Lachnobacterium sp.]|nr:flagellar filament capping protein FliD [Lachnobacterium sp.]
MAMRVSGINSGLDTDSIVQELVSAYNTKTEKYQKEQTKLSWKQEIWKGLNTKVYSLYNNVGKLRFSSAYSTKKTTSSDTTKATVSASSNAVNGTQKLHVLATAQSGYLTGGKLSLREEVTDTDGTTKLQDVKGTVKAETKLSEIGFTGDEASLNINTTDEEGNAVTKTVSLTKDSTIQDVVNALKDNGLNASFDANNGRIFVSSKNTGKAADFSLSSATTKLVEKKDADGNVIKDSNGKPEMESVALSAEEQAASKKLIGLLGLDTDSSNTYGNKAAKIDGRDAVIALNGVKYTNTTNDFAINGLNISVNGVTDDVADPDSTDLSSLNDSTAITINTATDSQGIYDTVKDFLTEYNNIINEITKLYNADSAGSYEPLTDDEKDKMSDTEIEKWETKIKDSLLRRDSSLSSVMNAMMTSMSQPIEINGKSYSLSSFGIQTLGFLNAAENEQNAYHIDGDEDDENTSGNDDKLMAAITSDPDTVIEFMKQLSTNLYKSIDDQMQSNDLRSRYKIYNDKEMDKQYTNLTKTIKEWESKVSDKEDYYYKQFSNMETALAKLQSQTSSISSMLGS